MRTDACTAGLHRYIVLVFLVDVIYDGTYACRRSDLANAAVNAAIRAHLNIIAMRDMITDQNHQS